MFYEAQNSQSATYRRTLSRPGEFEIIRNRQVGHRHSAEIYQRAAGGKKELAVGPITQCHSLFRF